MDRDQPLTEKQSRFVEEYLVDLNAAAAARRAGYSKSTARYIGYENLTKPHIQAAVGAAIERRTERTEITQDRVLRELARVGFADIRDLMRWGEDRVVFHPSDELTPEQAAVISKVKSRQRTVRKDDGTEITTLELELATYDKLSALEKLAKHVGLYDEPGSDDDNPLVVRILG